jgi:hypothetical protein
MRYVGTVMAALIAVTSPLSAEEACVKYHKCVPLDQFKCTEVSRSTNVKRVCYAGSKRYLIIKLKDTYYHYCEIGADIVAELLAAPSVGGYYTTRIRSQAANNRAFDCRDHPIPAF